MNPIADIVCEMIDKGDVGMAANFIRLKQPLLTSYESLQIMLRLRDANVLACIPAIISGLDDYFEYCDPLPTASIGSTPSSAASLDFLVVPTLRGSSRAMEIFLNLHPELHVPPRIHVDNVFRDAVSHELLAELNVLRNKFSGVRTGIVLHGGVGKLNTFLNIMNLFSRDKPWVQIVREPHSAILSSMNHQLNGTHGYYFPKVGLPWPTGEDLADANPVDYAPPIVERKFEIDQDEVLHTALEFKHDFRIGFPLYEYFGTWTAIDAAELLPDRIDEGLSSIFTQFGVDASFRHDAFHRMFHNRLPRYMYMNPVAVTVMGHNLILALGLPGDNLICHDWKTLPNWALAEYLETVRVDGNEILESIGLPGGTGVLLAETKSWFDLPKKVKLFLSESDVLERYFVDTFIPRWASNVAAIEAWVAPHKIDALTIEQRNLINCGIGKDLQAFLAHHPHLGESWERAVAA